MIGTIEGFRAYAADRGNDAPSNASDADATAALVRGSDYVRQAFWLVVEETDERVIDAAYVAASFELAESGFFERSASDKILTGAGDIEWTVRVGGATNEPGLTPKDRIKAILGGAAAGAVALLRS